MWKLKRNNNNNNNNAMDIEDNNDMIVVNDNHHNDKMMIMTGKNANNNNNNNKNNIKHMYFTACKDGGSTELIKQIIKKTKGECLKYKTENNGTGFLFACCNGNTSIVKLLIKSSNGKCLKDSTEHGTTGFLTACIHNRSNIIKLLFKVTRGRCMDDRLNGGGSGFSIVCGNGNFKLLRLLCSLIRTTGNGNSQVPTILEDFRTMCFSLNSREKMNKYCRSINYLLQGTNGTIMTKANTHCLEATSVDILTYMCYVQKSHYIFYLLLDPIMYKHENLCNKSEYNRLLSTLIFIDNNHIAIRKGMDSYMYWSLLNRLYWATNNVVKHIYYSDRSKIQAEKHMIEFNRAKGINHFIFNSEYANSSKNNIIKWIKSTSSIVGHSFKIFAELNKMNKKIRLKKDLPNIFKLHTQHFQETLQIGKQIISSCYNYSNIDVSYIIISYTMNYKEPLLFTEIRMQLQKLILSESGKAVDKHPKRQRSNTISKNNNPTNSDDDEHKTFKRSKTL